jgi:excisionase family DNA binding protein
MRKTVASFEEDDSITTILRARRGAISADTLAKLLCVSRQYLYDHAARGTIPALKLPGMIRFDPARIADWLDECAA